MYEIPGEITPEDLFGFSIKDRIEKFQKYNTIVDKSMNELKMIGGNNFKIFNTTKNPTAKENYEKSIELFKKQGELKKKFLTLAKNKWQPLPEVQVISEMFTDVQKAGEVDLSITGVNVKLEISENFRDISKYSYKFKWMDGNDEIKKMKVPNSGEVQERVHKIDFGHHKKLSDLKVVIKIKYWRLGLFDKTVNTFETNLAQLKKEEKIKKNFKYEDHKFYVTIWLDIPMNEEKKNLEEIKIIDIAYVAPPFKSATGGDGGGHSDSSQPKKKSEGGSQQSSKSDAPTHLK